MADVAGVAVEVEDGGHLLALLPGLLDQEEVQLGPVPRGDEQIVEGKIEHRRRGDKHPALRRLVRVVEQLVSSL